MLYLIPCFIYSVLFLINSSALETSCVRSLAITQIIISIMLVMINMYMVYYIINNNIYFSNNILFTTNMYITYITIFFSTLMCTIHLYYSDLTRILSDIRLCRDKSFIFLQEDSSYIYSCVQFDNPKSYILINAIPTLIFTTMLYYDIEFFLAYIMIIRFLLTIMYTIL